VRNRKGKDWERTAQPLRDIRGRQLPHHLESEASILGGIILRNDALALLDSLEVEHFYDNRHKVVFTAMRNLEAGGRPIDIVTLENEIAAGGRLEAIGGVGFLGELTMRVPTVDNVEAYAADVRKHHVTREVMVTLSTLLDEAYHGETQGEQLVNDVTTALLSVRTADDSPIFTMAELIAEEATQICKDVEARARGEQVFAGVPTGIDVLDEKVGGHPLATPALYIGRPANGKTTVAMLLNRTPARIGLASALATYEDRGQSFGQRGLAQESGIATELLRARRLKAEDVVTVLAGQHAGRTRLELVLPAAGMSAETLVRRLRRENLRRKHRNQPAIKQLIVDYVQKMPRPEHARSDDEAITHISQVLSAYAVADNVALVMMAQLNREVEKRDDHRPRLSDIRSSGSLEQDGKLIIGLYRPWLYEPNKTNPDTGEKFAPQDLHLLCLKNHQGEAGFDIKLWWDVKSHSVHNTQLDQGAQRLARGVDFSKRTKQNGAPEYDGRFDEAPLPESER
jgi:replicative DNA helicase